MTWLGAKPVPPDPDLTGITVLVVNDELAEVAGRVVETLGGRALVAHSIRDAREILSQNRPDAAVIDLLLSDGNGTDLIRELRLTRPEFPCVLFSGLDLPTVAREEAPYAVFLGKPFSREELGAAVLEAIGKADTERPPR